MAVFTGCQVESDDEPAKTFTVTFNANGGSGEMKELTAEEGAEITLTANAFTKEGSTFSGWNTAADGKGTDHADKSTIKLTENLTLYAQWNKISYTVKFDKNGGEGKLPDDITATSGEEFTLPAAELTRTGYDFKGWCTTADGTGTTYEADSKAKDLAKENSATVTLYAKWVLLGNWSINYVLNDNEANPAQNAETNPTEYNIETATITLADPTRSLYEFAGWYDNAKFEGEKLTGWKAGEKNSDITLYAKWAITQASISAAIEAGITEIKLAGEISEDIITAIRSALYENSDARINLDISGTTGLTEIPEDAFYDDIEGVACEALVGIVLPEGIESINQYAFWRCPNLTDIVIPDSVKIIDYAAFQGSGLASIKFGSGLELIGKWAFQVCKSLAKITVPGSVKTIGKMAFFNCYNIEEVIFEEGVQTIEDSAFNKCRKLATVTIPRSVTHIGSYFYTFGALQTVNYGGTMAEWKAFVADAEKFGTDNDELLNAVIICTDGSLNTDAASVIKRLGEGEHTVTVTGDVSADYLAEIADAIYYKNYSGTKIILDLSGTTGLTKIPDFTFYKEEIGNMYALVGIVLPQSVTSIGESAFQYSELSEIVIPDSVTEIGISAFSDTPLKSIKIGSGVTKIGNLAFCSTALTSIEIPDNVTSVGTQIFQTCYSLKDVTIGKGLASISNSMFVYCSALEEIVIPEEVKSIERRAFGSCEKLETITIPASVTLIEDYAFDCTSLADVYYGGTVAEWNALKDSEGFSSTGNDALLNATIHCSDDDITPTTGA